MVVLLHDCENPFGTFIIKSLSALYSYYKFYGMYHLQFTFYFTFTFLSGPENRFF